MTIEFLFNGTASDAKAFGCKFYPTHSRIRTKRVYGDLIREVNDTPEISISFTKRRDALNIVTS